MRNRIISNLLVVFLILSSFSFTAFADEKDPYTLDNSERFESQQEFLRTIGLIDKKETILPSDKITRGRFAKIVCDSVGMAENIPADENKIGFSDVNSDHIYANAIYTLYSMKVIKGDDNKFSPDNNITYDEALHMFLCAMGYREYVDFNGGYPVGDYTIARKIGIKKISGTVASAENILNLVIDCLKAKTLEVTSYSQNSVEYDNKNSDTILKKYFGIEYGTGVLESDGVVSINTMYEVKAKTVVIDGESFSSNLKFNERPGLKVEYFYTDDNQELVYLYTADRNSVVELNAEDIKDFSNMEYKYDDAEGNSETIKLEENVTIVYNNELMKSFDQTLMIPKDGYVMLIDNNNDDIYEVSYIFSYTSFLVKNVSVSNDYVIVYPDSQLSIKPLRIPIDSNKKILIHNSKGFTDYKSIKAGVSVSAYLIDNDPEYYTCHEMIISDKSVTGSLSVVNSERMSYIINGEEYKLTYLFETVKAPNIGASSECVFFLNHEGKIVDIDYENSGNMAYGYVLAAGYHSYPMEEPVIQIKVFSELGRVIIYDLSNKKITVDGVTYKNGTEAAVRPGLFNAGGSVKKQLIRYAVNSDKEIVKIDFPEDILLSSSANDNDTLFKMIPETALYYKKNISTFSGSVKIDDSTLIMKLTGSESGNDESEFSVMTLSDIESEGKYKIEAYSLDPLSFTADVVVLRYNYDDLPINSRPVIVKKTSTALNMADEQTYCLTIDGTDGEQRLICKNSDVLKKAKSISSSDLNTYTVSPGDVIRYICDRNGEVEAIRIIYKYDTDTILNSLTPGISNVFNNNRVIKGYIYDINNNYMRVMYNNPLNLSATSVISATDYEIYDFSVFSTFVVEQTDKTRVNYGKLSDIDSYVNIGKPSEVIVCTDNGTEKLLIIRR